MSEHMPHENCQIKRQTTSQSRCQTYAAWNVRAQMSDYMSDCMSKYVLDENFADQMSELISGPLSEHVTQKYPNVRINVRPQVKPSQTTCQDKWRNVCQIFLAGTIRIDVRT